LPPNARLPSEVEAFSREWGAMFETASQHEPVALRRTPYALTKKPDALIAAILEWMEEDK
jgi:hypothetical protein